MAKDYNSVSSQNLLVPVIILALTLLGMILFQTIAIMQEHSGLNAAFEGQAKPLEQAQKVQLQLDALATGTMKLAGQGNKDAQATLARLKQMGVSFSPNKKDGDATPAAVVNPAMEPAKVPDAAPAQ